MKKTFVYLARWAVFCGQPGMVLMEYDQETGAIKFVKDLDTENQYNFMFVDQERSILYACNEVDKNPRFKKGGGGFLCAYKINPEDGSLTEMSKVETLCPNPCYISIDPTGKFLVCANHSAYNGVTKVVKNEDGTFDAKLEFDDSAVNLYEMNEDGSIGKLVDIVLHTGLHPGFLFHAHPHCAVWNPEGSFFVVTDKGEGKIYPYKIDAENEKIVQVNEPFKMGIFEMPRYGLFNPKGNYFYHNNEGNTNIVAYKYTQDGTFEPLGSVSCLPDDVPLPEVKGRQPGQKPAQQCLTISADGRYIYDVINGKGIDGISTFKIKEDGMLERIQYLPVTGKWPRGVQIAPDGKSLIVCSIDGEGEQMSFFIKEDGTLEDTGKREYVPAGAYAVFYEA